ncbi:MAG: neutral zinc metallopeptidase [Paracoccaceae bacterium]|jgi:predicted metalloprotease
MKWEGRRGSDNIEDRRGVSTGRVVGGGGLGLVAMALIVWALGGDPMAVLQGGMSGGQIQSGGGEITEADKKAAEFVSVTLADTEQVWTDVFQNELGRTYTPTTLVLFKGATQSACGGASAQTGPFYCPGDKKVYLDTDFFATLSQRLGARGDFAAAYVVAHEVGHHVQDELGILGKANSIREQSSQTESNDISVRIELQADCFSGVWARYAADKLGTLEQGDIQEAVNAAQQIGDDTLQANAGQTPMPDSFTHGTSEQRQRWLATGYKSGTIKSCDTFSTNQL